MSELVERLRTGQQVNAPYEQEHWIPAPRVQLQAADTIEAQAVRIKVLREALADAIVCVQDWSAYVAPYYLEKHDLHGDLARLRAALEKTK